MSAVITKSSKEHLKIKYKINKYHYYKSATYFIIVSLLSFILKVESGIEKSSNDPEISVSALDT